MIIDGDGPVSSKWRFQETEADLGGCSGSILRGGSVRSPVTEFKIGVGLMPITACPGAEQDRLARWARRSVGHELEMSDQFV